MISLLEQINKQISIRFKHKGITLCSDYSSKFRIMGKPFPGPYSVKHHPWCLTLLDCNQDWCGCKAAQMGFTEVALNRCFFTIDIQQNNVMYVLPKTDPDASDFSSARFTPALELSTHLDELFQDANNVGHKRAGNVNLYVRGAQARSGLKSVPASLMIFDEVDEMPPKNIELATQRTSGQLEAQNIYISTPTLPGFGVDKYYQKSSKEHFFFKCPSCSQFIELDDKRSLVITADSINDKRISESHYICYECKSILPHEGKIDYLQSGVWVPEVKDVSLRGFQIPQLYSMAKAGPAPAVAEVKIRGDFDAAAKQEYYNSTLGKAFVDAGSRVTLEQINSLLRDYTRSDIPKTTYGIRVMWVDVGTWLHWEVGEFKLEGGLTNDLNALAMYKQLSHGKVANFEELDELMRKYQIIACVIDANPERRKAREFAERFHGHVFLCFYANGLKGNEITVSSTNLTTSVDRTNWMDMALGRFNSNRLILPRDTMEEYKTHIQAVMRRYDKDHNGNPVGVWVSNEADHFAHARTYNEIALPVAATIVSGNKDIQSFL